MGRKTPAVPPAPRGWRAELREALAHLSWPQVKVLEECGLGVTLAEGGGPPQFNGEYSWASGGFLDRKKLQARGTFSEREKQPCLARGQTTLEQGFAHPVSVGYTWHKFCWNPTAPDQPGYGLIDSTGRTSPLSTPLLKTINARLQAIARGLSCRACGGGGQGNGCRPVVPNGAGGAMTRSGRRTAAAGVMSAASWNIVAARAQQAAPGFSNRRLQPRLADLGDVTFDAHTVGGCFRLRTRRRAGCQTMEVTVPAGVGTGIAIGSDEQERPVVPRAVVPSAY